MRVVEQFELGGRGGLSDASAGARRAGKAAFSIKCLRVTGSNWSQTWLRQSAKCGRSIFGIGSGATPSSTSR